MERAKHSGYDILLLHHIYLHTGAASTLPTHMHEYKILVGRYAHHRNPSQRDPLCHAQRV